MKKRATKQGEEDTEKKTHVTFHGKECKEDFLIHTTLQTNKKMKTRIFLHHTTLSSSLLVFC